MQKLKTNTEALLIAKNIGFVKKGKAILKDVSLSISSKEIVTLIGPNGAGKTTLIRILLKMLQPVTGNIITKPGVKFGYVPQRFSVNNVLPLRVDYFLQLSGKFNHQQVKEALQEFGVGHLIDSPIQQVSGGELQRILIARALLTKPDLIILDEPAQGVDIIGQQVMYETISNIREKHDCAVLMVSHDLHLVMSTTDHVICLNTHVCCTGHPDSVSEHPEYLKMFGSALDGLAVYSHHHDHTHDIHGNIINTEQDTNG